MIKKQEKKKRACIIRQKAYPMQRNMRRNAETLVREGYDVDVLCYGRKDQAKNEVLSGVNVHRIYFLHHRDSIFWYFFDYMVFFLLVSFHLIRLSFKKRFDVIEVCNIPDFLLFSTLIPKLLGSKVIYFMFEKSESMFTDTFKLSRTHILTRMYNMIIKLCALYADYVFVTDMVVQKDLPDFYGIRPEKVSLILNVVDEEVFNFSPESQLRKNNEFQVLIVSSVLKRYGIQTMVQAIPLLVKEIPDLAVRIIGWGEYGPILKDMSEELGISDYIHFDGYFPYEEIPARMALADVCVAPMIEDVGTPNKVLEYLGMGKATVSTDLPGLVALIDSDCMMFYPTGSEVELAERIIELYHNPEKRIAMGKCGQEFYNKHRWAEMKKKYLEVYHRLSS